jgi:hypothetical protein
MECIFASIVSKISTGLANDVFDFKSNVDAYSFAHRTDVKGLAWRLAWNDDMLRAFSVCLVPTGIFGEDRSLGVGENEKRGNVARTGLDRVDSFTGRSSLPTSP